MPGVKFDPKDPGNHIPLGQMTQAERDQWVQDYMAWDKAQSAQQQVNTLEQLYGSMKMIEDNKPQPAGGDSPFLNYTQGYGEIPSVDAYGGGNTPPHWKALYGAIQSGAAKIKSVPDGEGGSYLALVDKNGNPTRSEVTELAPGVYKVYSGSGQYSQQFVVGTDPKSGYVSPITDYSKQSNSWRHSYEGGGLSGFVQDIAKGIMDLGPLGKVGMAYAIAQTGGALASTLGISTAAGTALASAGLQVAQGKSVEDAIKAAAVGYAGGTAGQTVGGAVAELAKDTGLDPSLTNVLGKTAGSVASGATKSALTGTDFDPLAAIQQSLVGQAVGAGTDAIKSAAGDFQAQAVDDGTTAGIQDTISAMGPSLVESPFGFSAYLPTFDARFDPDQVTPVSADVAVPAVNTNPFDMGPVRPGEQLHGDLTTDDLVNIIQGNDIQTGGADAVDDGTTEGIQQVIDNTPINLTPQTSGPAVMRNDSSPTGYVNLQGDTVNADGTPWVDPTLAVDDGTTDGIQDVIDQLPLDDGTTTGIQDIIDQLPVDDGTTEGIQEVIDQTTSESSIPAVSPSSPATTPPPASKPSSVSTPSAPKIPTDQAPSNGLDLASLLALLGSSGTAAPAAPPPTVDIGEQLDISAPLELNPFARKQTQSKMAAGGSIDDLLALLQQRG